LVGPTKTYEEYQGSNKNYTSLLFWWGRPKPWKDTNRHTASLRLSRNSSLHASEM
jgi:hypothetical protein